MNLSWLRHSRHEEEVSGGGLEEVADCSLG